VKPRATRIALIVASVPLETKRSISTCGIRSVTSSASSTSASVGIPKLVPRRIARPTASSTTGGA
jgi:hypothetical protein